MASERRKASSQKTRAYGLRRRIVYEKDFFVVDRDAATISVKIPFKHSVEGVDVKSFDGIFATVSLDRQRTYSAEDILILFDSCRNTLIFKLTEFAGKFAGQNG